MRCPVMVKIALQTAGARGGSDTVHLDLLQTKHCLLPRPAAHGTAWHASRLTDESGRPILLQGTANSKFPMTTSLDKTLRRQIRVNGQDYIIALSPEGLKITLKGKRKGLELSWSALISGDAALAVALNASVGQFAAQPAAKEPPTQKGGTARHSRRSSRS
jgi:hypothetical protein